MIRLAYFGKLKASVSIQKLNSMVGGIEEEVRRHGMNVSGKT